VQNAVVREYRRRCNTVENIYKVIGSWNRVILVRETVESAACPITKARNNSKFYIPLIFVLYFHSQFQWFFSLFDTFSHLRNLIKRVQPGVTIPKVTCFVRFLGWMRPNSNTSCYNIFFVFCFPFISLPFSKVILKNAELPSLHNIVSSLHQLFGRIHVY